MVSLFDPNSRLDLHWTLARGIHLLSARTACQALISGAMERDSPLSSPLIFQMPKAHVLPLLFPGTVLGIIPVVEFRVDV